MALGLALIMKREKRPAMMIMAVMLATAQFAQGQVGQVTTGKRAVAFAVYAPRPQYPFEARSQGITGSGVFVAKVDPKSGNVLSVTVARSTGSPILDNAATSALRQWRLQPNTVHTLNVPMTFYGAKKTKN